MAGASQRKAQFIEIVNFTIKYNPDSTVVIGHRLVATGQIDDAQPVECKADIAVGEDPRVIRSTVGGRFAHA